MRVVESHISVKVKFDKAIDVYAIYSSELERPAAWLLAFGMRPDTKLDEILRDAEAAVTELEYSQILLEEKLWAESDDFTVACPADQDATILYLSSLFGFEPHMRE